MNILQLLKSRYNDVKNANITIGSMRFLEIVIAFSFIPVVVTVGMFCAVTTFHWTDAWCFQVIEEGMKIIDHTWSAQLVAGVLAYASKLKDTNHDGIIDEFEGKESK